MSAESQDVLVRFHRALVREIQAKNPEHLASAFTVAEIYQNLIPYRTHRDELGVEMNGDYEHALLRVLAGEGDFLSIESRTARHEIREELESPNPNTGLYRDFAAADVRLNPEKIDEALGWMDEETEDEQEADAEDQDEFRPQQGFEAEELRAVEEASSELAEEGADGVPEGVEEMDRIEETHGVDDMAGIFGGEGETEAELDSRVRPPEVTDEPEGDEETAETGVEGFAPAGDESFQAESEPGEAEDSGDAAPETCPWCRENLPRRGGVKFCPFCGSNVQMVPCPECGEELELNWRFCVACGTEVAS